VGGVIRLAAGCREDQDDDGGPGERVGSHAERGYQPSRTGSIRTPEWNLRFTTGAILWVAQTGSLLCRGLAIRWAGFTQMRRNSSRCGFRRMPCRLPVGDTAGCQLALHSGSRTTSEFGVTCISDFIFLVWREPNRKIRLLAPLQGRKQRRTRERASRAGLTALRHGVRSGFADCPKLEPLLEHAGLPPTGLVFLQV
jgi:hypothetical protein